MGKERTSNVGMAFWTHKKAKGSSVESTGDKLYSYGTVIAQHLPDGKTIGNASKYSVTTSRHQSQCNVRAANYTVTGVPRGTTDLKPYLKK